MVLVAPPSALDGAAEFPKRLGNEKPDVPDDVAVVAPKGAVVELAGVPNMLVPEAGVDVLPNRPLEAGLPEPNRPPPPEVLPEPNSPPPVPPPPVGAPKEKVGAEVFGGFAMLILVEFNPQTLKRSKIQGVARA